MPALTPDQEKLVTQLFGVFSEDKANPALKLDKLTMVMKQIGLEGWTEASDAEKWFKAVDFDNSGTVSIEEFKQVYATRLMADKRADILKERFKTIDKDGNGILSLDELYEAVKPELKGTTKEDMESLIKDFATEPGKFKVDDFIAFFRCSPIFNDEF